MTLQKCIYGTLLCVVIITPLLLIHALGSSTFFSDEWSLIPFLERVWHGQATFYDYWSAFAEQRIFFPRLIFASVYRPDGTDPRQIMIISWLIITAMYTVAIRFFFLRHREIAPSSRFLYAFCFLNLGLSLVQYENWLYALQLDFFLTQSFVILAAIFMSVDSVGNGPRGLLVAICAASASLCTGQGMLLWLSGGFCMFLIAQTWVSRSALAFGFLFGMAFFVWLYHADGSGKLALAYRFPWIIHRPIDFVWSFFGLIGNPLSFCFTSSRIKQAPIIGIALSLLLAFQISAVVNRKLLRQSLPFILVGSFGYFYCGLVTLGRAENGINEFLLTSRYATNAVSVPLAIVGLSSTLAIFSRRENRSIEIDLLLFTVPLFLLLALNFSSEVGAIELAGGDAAARRFTAGLLPFVTLFDKATDGVATGPFYPLCPVDNSKFIDGAIFPGMKAGLISGPREVKVTHAADIEVHVQTDVERKTVVYLSHRMVPRVVEGWVRIPKEIGNPQAILLRKPGEEKFLAATRLEKEKQSENGFSLYRWEFLVLPILDPHPGTGFEAALLNEKSAILYPLGYVFQ